MLVERYSEENFNKYPTFERSILVFGYLLFDFFQLESIYNSWDQIMRSMYYSSYLGFQYFKEIVSQII